MATWRVFKKQATEPPIEGETHWLELPPLESEYDYAVDADEVGKVAGAGEYLLFKQGEYARPVEIEVCAITRYEEVEPPEEQRVEEEPEPGFSVAVTDEQAEPVQP